MKTLTITLLAAILLFGNVIAQTDDEFDECEGLSDQECIELMTGLDFDDEDFDNEDMEDYDDDEDHEDYYDDHDDYEYDPEEYDDMTDEEYEALAMLEFMDSVTYSDWLSGLITDLWSCYDTLEANDEDWMWQGYVFCDSEFEFDFDDYLFPDYDDEYGYEDDMDQYDGWNEADTWELEERLYCMVYAMEMGSSGDECWEDDFSDYDMESGHYDQWGEFDSEFEEDESMFYLEEYFGSWTASNWAQFMAGQNMAWLQDANATPSEDMYFAFTYLFGLANPSEHHECHSTGTHDDHDHEGHDDELPEGVTEDDIAAALEEEGIDTDDLDFGRMLQAPTEEEWHDEFGVMYDLDTEACQDAIAYAEELAFNYMGFNYDFAGHPILTAGCTGSTDVSSGCLAAQAAYRRAMLAAAMDMMYAEDTFINYDSTEWAEENLSDTEMEKAENNFADSINALFAGNQSMLSMSLIAIFAALWN